MLEAFRIGVTIALVNKASSALGLIARDFNRTDVEAKKLQRTMKEISLLTIGGSVLAGAGLAGLGAIARAVKPAEQYAHQLNIINMAGWTQRDIAVAVGDAWKNTGNVITTTATGNLHTLLDLKNVLGTMGEARMALPIVSRIQAVLAASSETKISSHSDELGYSMAKALDIIGAARNPAQFEKQAEMMAKVIIATQGRVTPEMYKSVFQYARQAKFALSDEFKYEILDSLMQENAGRGGGGGGSRGVGPMLAAFYRFTNQGYINKKSLPELIKLGLLKPGTELQTTTQGTTVGSLTNAGLAGSNPFEWVQTVLMPAIKAKYGNLTEQQTIAKIGEIFRGNQLAAQLAMEFAFKPQNFYRDQANIQRTMSTAQAYQAAISSDPNTVRKALSAQWINFQTALTMSIVPVLVPALMKLTRGLNHLAMFERKHPRLTQFLVLTAAGLSALAVVLGGIAVVAGGLMLVTLAVGGAITAGTAIAIAGIAAGIVALGSAVTVWWDKIAAFFNWIAGEPGQNAGASSMVGARGPGSRGFVPPGRNQTPINHHITVKVGDQKVAQVVTRSLGHEMSKPSTGPSHYNPRVSPARSGSHSLSGH